MPQTKSQPKLATIVSQLEQARTQIGVVPAKKLKQEIVRLLSATDRAAVGKDAEALIRFHDLLLFLRAFPPGLAVLRLADTLLGKIETKVKGVLAAGADPDDFAPEEVAGIAGTVVEATFSYPMVCWLVEHHPKAIAIQWDDYERDPQRGLIWPRFFPLMEEDSLIEANVPYLAWLKAARGRQDELPWLVQQFQRMPLGEKEKSALYDSLEIMVRWDMSGSRASRTLSRKPVKQFYFHREPLIQRRQVSFKDELAKPPLPVKVLAGQQAVKTLDLMKETLGVRYRELYGTSNADPVWVVQADVGRGVEIYLCGLPAEKRLPLRAYLAGFTVKNGVPINYFECSSLFDWTEIGFNTFPAYRDGETAWVYAQTLRLCGNYTAPTPSLCIHIKLAMRTKKPSAPELSGSTASWASVPWILNWKSWRSPKKRKFRQIQNIARPRQRCVSSAKPTLSMSCRMQSAEHGTSSPYAMSVWQCSGVWPAILAATRRPCATPLPRS